MDEQQIQQQIIQLVQAAMQGDQQANQYIQQVIQAAQQGDQQAQQLAGMIQQVAQQIQGQQAQMAKRGAKLNYIRQLRGTCPEGYEMEYFKQGGTMGKRCKRCENAAKKQDGGEVNAVDAFKCGRKMKKIKKAQDGSKQESPEQVKKVKTIITYPDRLEANERKVQYYDDGTYSVMNSGWNPNTGMWTSSFRGRQGEFGDYDGTSEQQQVADSIHNTDFMHLPMYLPIINRNKPKLKK